MALEDILLQKTKGMIDGLKTVCANYGLANDSSEYKIITETFLYKFLNDRFLYEIAKHPVFDGVEDIESAYVSLDDTTRLDVLMKLEANVAIIDKSALVSVLFNNSNKDGFHVLFDDALKRVADDNQDIFSVKTGGGSRIRLFEGVSRFILDENKRDGFCRALINALAKFSFADVFGQRYDFFSAVFEYLIKDYNKDSGSYGEYFTPHSIASIIAKILVPDGAENVTVYDPAAGSGTLALAIAHEIGEDNCTIYTQDRSQKANEFMRLNLILNGLVSSLPNVVHEDTLVDPRHQNASGTRVKQFDYVVSNPPFKCDFSETRDTLAGDAYKSRFWAGVPKIPAKKPEGMAIYLMFLQHILYSMENDGKAAIVVPTGFLTAKSKIELKIRKKLIDGKMLRGVISMPSNIFANTGTNVSILFVDSSEEYNEAFLVDASSLGKKIKLDGKNQRTVLSDYEISTIIDTFNSFEIREGFSVLASYGEMVKKKYSFSAGQYFETKLEYIAISDSDYQSRLEEHVSRIGSLFADGDTLKRSVLESIGDLRNG